MHYIDEIKQSIEVLKVGRPIIIPTDTVFGLAVSIMHADGPQVLYELKHRPSNMAIPCLISGIKSLDYYVSTLSKKQRHFAKKCWPGATTLIFPNNNKYPSAFQCSKGTVAFRMPDHDFVLQLIEALGNPLACTSANIHGQDATNYFEKISPVLRKKVFCPLPTDISGTNHPSEIFDCTKIPFTQLR